MLFQESAAAKENGSASKVMSAEQAEDLKMKEKRKREREVLVFLCVFCNNLSTESPFGFLFVVLIVGLIIIEKSAEEEKEKVGGCSRAIRR